MSEIERHDVIFVYDGACPICNYAAHATRIQKNVGDLILIDARTATENPVLEEITNAGLDLDEGMVLKYKEKLYHGQDALQLMARLGAAENWFNRTNRILFRSNFLSGLGYPPMRAARNFLIRLRGASPINNLKKRP